jgi:DIS3-like exonuclease 2
LNDLEIKVSPLLPNDVVNDNDDNSSSCAETTDVDLSRSSSAACDLTSLNSVEASSEQATEQTRTPTRPLAGSSSSSKNASDSQRSAQKYMQDRYTTVKAVRSDASPSVRRLFDTSCQDSEKKQVNGMILRTGKVVYIVDKKHTRAACGNLKLMGDRNRQNVLFAPTDHRVPRIIIPMSDCPQGFFERPDDFKNTLFIARITEWKENMMMPKGNLMRSLGEAGEIEPTTEGILFEYGVDTSDFSEEVLGCLPKNLPWSIPPAEFKYRRDLRQQCIFTIDPSTARDLDDSLSCEDLGDGFYEIGVHIADVSFFVEPNTALDKVAADRATSVYLVQKVVPMLPHLLCEQLCSLNPGEDRLAFSVIWKMTPTGEVIDEWFGRTVIRSCVKFSYDHAQGFIDEPTRNWTTEELPSISDGVTVADIRQRVLKLNEIAVNLRKKRFDNGALRLDQVKLQYSLDKETGLPCGYSVYQQKDSNRLIEEFMLLANMAVAHKITRTYPELAVLRRHPPPQTRQIDELMGLCESFGLDIDFSSAGSLHHSLSSYGGDCPDDESRLQILISLCSRPMQNARYFCAGTLADESDYHHYALNVPLYTHFTSPIRRYPDIMVHRLLAAALGYIKLPTMEPNEVQMQCELCNDKKLAAKRVSELSSELFFSVFIKKCGPMYERGMVMNVLDKSFDVLLLKVGVIKRVYCEGLKLSSFSFKKVNKKPELTLTWAQSVEHPEQKPQSITLFTSVCCRISAGDEPLRWNADILHPSEQLPN